MGEQRESNKFDKISIEIIDNVMKYENEAIQVSSISQIRVAKEPEKQYSIISIAGMAISIVGMVGMAVLFPLWLIIAIWCGIKILKVYGYNSSLSTYLIVEMNSGRTSLFSAEDESFLIKAKDSLVESFNQKNAHMIVNFANCNVKGNCFGENGTINNCL